MKREEMKKRMNRAALQAVEFYGNKILSDVERQNYCDLTDHISCLDDDIANLKAQLAEAESVIRFYGSDNNWCKLKGSGDRVMFDCDKDYLGGKRARGYLKKWGKG